MDQGIHSSKNSVSAPLDHLIDQGSPTREDDHHSEADDEEDEVKNAFIGREGSLTPSGLAHNSHHSRILFSRDLKLAVSGAIAPFARYLAAERRELVDVLGVRLVVRETLKTNFWISIAKEVCQKFGWEYNKKNEKRIRDLYKRMKVKARKKLISGASLDEIDRDVLLALGREYVFAGSRTRWVVDSDDQPDHPPDYDDLSSAHSCVEYGDDSESRQDDRQPRLDVDEMLKIVGSCVEHELNFSVKNGFICFEKVGLIPEKDIVIRIPLEMVGKRV
ncbi:unnamed protein product [Bursaphelenchus xylophilus]|uniref:(pine wood nematode) hypothetical protein n=1 Tax=Bursaphelenchus xylophilus TaxID=6326 RepID=A0A1I7S0A0_BURXY|nr:unnamed protein product [Bursaphelenchus xylophilus]CAG9108934.1 unnamed protein product [Bursaphelenchus xylophilus]